MNNPPPPTEKLKLLGDGTFIEEPQSNYVSLAVKFIFISFSLVCKLIIFSEIVVLSKKNN